MKTNYQTRSAASRILSDNPRLVGQPPLEVVLQTYRDRHREFPLTPALPQLPVNGRGVMQGRFLGPDKNEIPEEEVLEYCLKQPSIMNEIGQRGSTGMVSLAKAIHKLAEGMDIQLDLTQPPASQFIERVFFFLRLVKEPPLRQPREAAWLKINRIAGMMQRNLAYVTVDPDILNLVFALSEMRDMGSVKALITTSGKELDRLMAMLAGGRMSGGWFFFDFLSMLGPLFYALSVLTEDPEVEAHREVVCRKLRILRQLMATHPGGITVVGHRGLGPTNRSMGGLIPQGDNRRDNRPAENSPSAFQEAMRSATQPSTPPQLDGIECDIFLSSDQVPMLSHEEKVKEQLNLAQQAAHPDWKDSTSMGGLTADKLLKTTRTQDPGSRFMSLEQLLEMVCPVAFGYFKATGNPFRVEVEMKGTTTGAVKKQFSKQKEMLDMEHPHAVNVRDRVLHVVSQFKKRHTDLPIEILLFNGVIGQVQGYGKKRAEKTALGSMYTGLNVKPGEFKHPGVEIDELRYMFFDDPELEFTVGHQDEFISTLVYGVETAPSRIVPMTLQPQRGVDAYFGKLYPSPLNDLATLFRLMRIDLSKPNKIHVLTDYAMKAQYLKRMLVERKIISAEVEEVFEHFYAIERVILEDIKAYPTDEKTGKRVMIGINRFICDFEVDKMLLVEAVPSIASLFEQADKLCAAIKEAVTKKWPDIELEHE